MNSMSKMKNLYMLVAEYLDEGLDEVEIARKLDIPVDMAQEIVETVYHQEETGGSNYQH